MSILVLITGGTIDNLNYSHQSDAVKNKESLVQSLIKQARINDEMETKVICFKDSKFIQDVDAINVRRMQNSITE